MRDFEKWKYGDCLLPESSKCYRVNKGTQVQGVTPGQRAKSVWMIQRMMARINLSSQSVAKKQEWRSMADNAIAVLREGVDFAQ